MILDGDVTILQGDALERLAELPAEIAHVCVTSPPFYGLRDYGTGTWEGGEVGCDHVRGELRRGVNLAASAHSTRGGAKKAAEVGSVSYGVECGKCGARRLDRQIGLEASPDEWVARLVEVLAGVRRVLRPDGTLWLEVGDSYAATGGHTSAGGPTSQRQGRSNIDAQLAARSTTPDGYKPKDLIGAPWQLAFALRDDGWWLRQELIWHRPNPMPESVRDRCTTAHTRVFLLAKSSRYYFDPIPIREPATNGEPFHGDYAAGHGGYASRNGRLAGGRQRANDGRYDANEFKTTDERSTRYQGANPDVAWRHPRSVWTIATQPLDEPHYAAFPEELVRRCLLAGSSERGVCPACGAPWRRQVDVDLVNVQATNASSGSPHGLKGDQERWPRGSLATSTTGWEAGCEHRLEPVPALVLDPFLGSGTTALVARKLGRRCVGIELSPDYVEIAARRLRDPAALNRAALAGDGPAQLALVEDA